MPAALAVIVDVPAGEAERAQPAITTCNKALGPGRCLLSSPPDHPTSEWFAVVRFTEEGQQSCSIELHQAEATGPTLATTELRFSSLDSPDERWASAGVVVAALVLAQSPAPAPVEPPPKVVPPPEPPPVVPPSKPVGVAEPRAWLRAEVGGQLGSDFVGGPWQVGGLTRVALAFNHPAAFLLGSFSYGVRPGGTPRLDWLGGSLGVGAHVGLVEGLAALELRTGAVFQSVLIEASQGARSESARRWRVGPGWGVDSVWYFSRNWALVAGFEAEVLRPRVVIEVADRTALSLPPLQWQFLSSVRCDLR